MGRMSSIKKYIPVIATLTLGISVLLSQVFFKSKDINASPSKKENKLNLHYESVFKELKYSDKGKKKIVSKQSSPVVIVNFWASWCIPCLEEFPSLVSLRKKYKESEVTIIGINTDDEESYKDAKKIIKKYSLNFPNVFDKDDKYIELFKVSAIPISIIYHKGKVVEVSNGAKDFYSGEFLEQVDSFIK